MKAVAIRPGGGLEVQEREVPEPFEGEALVRVILAGVCSTDLELRAGYMGFSGVVGHEFVGRVERAPGAPALEGRRAVGEINAGCGACSECERGDPRHCPGRTVLGILGRDGAFAEYLTLPVRNLHPVPEGLALERAVFAEPAAAAFEIPEQLEVKGRRALVLGAGKLGSLCARVLRLAGADVSVLARRRPGAALLEADGFEVLASEQAPARRFDLVVEVSGRPEGISRALELVRPRGTIVLKSTCAADRPINLAPVVIDEVTVVGSRCGPFAPALAALSRGDLAPEPTIAARYPLERAEEAFAAAADPADPARRKVLLEP